MIVGHTLVDASSGTASVLMVNRNTEEVVLPSFTCVGKLVPGLAISVALAEPVLAWLASGCTNVPGVLCYLSGT